MKIWLSSGHSGGQVGAVANGTNEETEARNIVVAAVEKMKNEGFAVELVPTNLKLAARIEWINKNIHPTETVVDVHLNSSGNKNTSGCEYYYERKKAVEHRLCTQLIARWSKDVDLPNHGAKEDTQSGVGRLGIIMDTRPRVLLLETGYITNVLDLAQVRKRGVFGLTNQVRMLLGVVPKEDEIEIPAWAAKSVEKCIARGWIKDWSEPNGLVTPERLSHVFGNMKLVSKTEEPMTWARLAVVLDKLVK
jgi:hypothetical protein